MDTHAVSNKRDPSGKTTTTSATDPAFARGRSLLPEAREVDGLDSDISSAVKRDVDFALAFP